MIQFILDCSVAISWCLVDESDDYANQILELMPNAEVFVPGIWMLEMSYYVCLHWTCMIVIASYTRSNPKP